MTNWLIIFNEKVINIIEKDGNINDDDLTATWDTITEDASKTFKIGDDFTAELQLQYNHDIWVERGWINDAQVDISTLDISTLPKRLQKIIRNQ